VGEKGLFEAHFCASVGQGLSLFPQNWLSVGENFEKNEFANSILETWFRFEGWF
jgi:hypothetical protein